MKKNTKLLSLKLDQFLNAGQDYREFAFRRNRGLRIDHVLVSNELKNQVAACHIDKAPRKNERPSDHTPVIVSLVNS